MADSILAIPLSTGGLGDGGWVAVAAFSLYNSSYSISSSAYDIGCIVSGAYSSARLITPFYFLPASSETYNVPYQNIDNSTGLFGALTVQTTSIHANHAVSASIILFKSA